MPHKIILGLVGPIAAGKGTIATYLEQKYSASTYRFSSIMRDLLIRLHLPLSRENLQDISTMLRQRFGEDLFAKVIAENVIQDNNKIIVVDGIRRLADIKYLTRIKDFVLVKVAADPHLRYQRLIKRTEIPVICKKPTKLFFPIITAKRTRKSRWSNNKRKPRSIITAALRNYMRKWKK